MADIAVIVLNWNGGGLAVESVASFVSQTRRARRLGGRQRIDRWIVRGHCRGVPQAHLIRNDRNRGYRAGGQPGSRRRRPGALRGAGQQRHHSARRRSLARVVEYMEAHPDVQRRLRPL